MLVHAYAVCWNEMRALPYFFRHYDRWVDRYFIFDDGSSDGSQEYLSKHPNVELRDFHRPVDSFVLSTCLWANSAWKESRGQCDWVIVTDIDEHLDVHGIDIHDYLHHCRRKGITAIPALGFQMFSKEPPAQDDFLSEKFMLGAPFLEMNKLNLFNPNAIDEMRYQVGRHRASPIGRVVFPEKDEMMLLHYKYMGVDEVIARHAALGDRLRQCQKDIQEYFGVQYFYSDHEFARVWSDLQARAVNVNDPVSLSKTDPAHTKLWWRPVDKGLKRWLRRRIGYTRFWSFLQGARIFLRSLSARAPWKQRPNCT